MGQFFPIFAEILKKSYGIGFESFSSVWKKNTV